MESLKQVRGALILALGGENRLPLLNARVILRTGVSLTQIEPHHDFDRGRVNKVLGALREMGFDLREEGS